MKFAPTISGKSITLVIETLIVIFWDVWWNSQNWNFAEKYIPWLKILAHFLNFLDWRNVQFIIKSGLYFKYNFCFFIQCLYDSLNNNLFEFKICNNFVIYVIQKMISYHMGRNKLNLKRVGMIFDLDENYTNYSLDLPPSFGDNVKSAGPP